MTDAPFGPFSDDGSSRRARPATGRPARRPWERAVRCPSTARRTRPEAGLERFQGFAALHAAISAGPEVSTRRLWTGGFGAAAVAAMMVFVGWTIAQGVLGVPVPAPVDEGAESPMTGLGYALCAAAVAVQATALLHLLMELSRRPVRTLFWIFGTLLAVAAVVPFAVDAPPESALATAVINVAAGIAMLSMLASAATLSTRWPDLYDG